MVRPDGVLVLGSDGTLRVDACVADKKYVPYLSDGRHGAQEKSQMQGFGTSAYALIEIKREKCKLIIVSYTRYSQHMIQYQHIHKLE